MNRKFILSLLLLTALSFASDTDSDDSDPLTQLTAAMGAHSISGSAVAASSPAAGSSTQAAPFPYKRAYFSPGINNAFFAILANEKSGFNMAMYTLTHMDVAKEILLRRQLNKLQVDVVVDKGFKDYACDALKHLITKGVVVKYMSGIKNGQSKSNKFENMHHKFVIFQNNAGGRKILWTGSFNFTGAAESQNWENVVIIDDPLAISEFEQEFDLINSKATPIQVSECVSTKSITPYTKKINALS